MTSGVTCRTFRLTSLTELTGATGLPLGETDLGEGLSVDAVAQFRSLLGVVEPAMLNVEDRMALLDLLSRCLEHKPAAGGGRRKLA